MQCTQAAWEEEAVFLERHKDLFSKNTFYDAVKRGVIPHVRVGRRIFVPKWTDSDD